MIGVWVVGGFMLLATILLTCILGRINTIMSNFQEFSDKLDAVIAEVAEIAAEIATLKAQQGPVSQEQLDSLDAKLQSVKDGLDAAK